MSFRFVPVPSTRPDILLWVHLLAADIPLLPQVRQHDAESVQGGEQVQVVRDQPAASEYRKDEGAGYDGASYLQHAKHGRRIESYSTKLVVQPIHNDRSDVDLVYQLPRLHLPEAGEVGVPQQDSLPCPVHRGDVLVVRYLQVFQRGLDNRSVHGVSEHAAFFGGYISYVLVVDGVQIATPGTICLAVGCPVRIFVVLVYCSFRLTFFHVTRGAGSAFCAAGCMDTSEWFTYAGGRFLVVGVGDYELCRRVPLG
ncbi:hypothetical protein H1R20_g1377, partial [Candolleomyces eurysporus]